VERRCRISQRLQVSWCLLDSVGLLTSYTSSFSFSLPSNIIRQS